MLIIFQIFFVIFTFYAIFGVWQKKKQGLLGSKGAIFWSIFWMVVAVAVAWPDTTARLAELFDIGRGVDIVIYISIATLFYLVFRLHIKLESMGRDITRLVRGRALLSKEKNKEIK